MRFAALVLAGCAVPTAPIVLHGEDGTFRAGAEEVPYTIVHPTTGTWPAIVMFAGSGPTDRDWNNPLLAGGNGSGRLIAHALARHGAVVLRFDKAPGGANKLPFEQITWATNLDEGRAAIALLRARKDVDPKRIFVLGNSEGGLHALRVAEAEPGVRGVILMASEGRSMRDIMMDQIDSQFAQAVKTGGMPKEVAEQLEAGVAKAFDDFSGGADVDPVQATPVPSLQALLKSIMYPPTAPLMRGMLAADPGAIAARIAQPVLVLNGEKDIQIDPSRDAKRLSALLGARGRLVLLPNANHVFKLESQPLDALKADVAGTQKRYNAPDAVLADDAIKAIVAWLDHQT